MTFVTVENKDAFLDKKDIAYQLSPKTYFSFKLFHISLCTAHKLFFMQVTKAPIPVADPVATTPRNTSH